MQVGGRQFLEIDGIVHVGSPSRLQAGTAFAHFLAGRYDDALSWTGKARWEQTNYATTIRVAAASYGLTGRLAEAQKIGLQIQLMTLEVQRRQALLAAGTLAPFEPAPPPTTVVA